MNNKQIIRQKSYWLILGMGGLLMGLWVIQANGAPTQPPSIFFHDGGRVGSAEALDTEVGDLDGDGDLDVFVATAYANEVWWQDDSGNFHDSGQKLADSPSQDAELGDADGDGDLDAFVINQDKQHRLWFNDGTGHFTDSELLPALDAELTNGGITLGDVDSDGDLDALIAHNYESSNPLTIRYILFNDGAGHFNLGLYLNDIDHHKSETLVMGDFDGDGDSDISDGRYVWFNEGLGNFTDAEQFHDSIHVHDVDLGDLDGDGDLDIFARNRVWLNNGTGHFSDTGQQFMELYGFWATLGDLDSDGDLDVMAEHIWLNDGTGHFTNTGQDGIENKPGNRADIELNDVDSDGDLDLIGSRLIERNDGTGHFSEMRSVNAHSRYGRHLEIGDLDNDGDLDIFAPDRLWFNDGTGHFDSVHHDLAEENIKTSVLGDLDGDGDLDAFIALGDTPALADGYPDRIWFNDGTGRFTDSGQALGDAEDRQVSLGDFDGDNDLDILIIVHDYPRLHLWLNDGTGHFIDSGHEGHTGSDWNPQGLAVGDVDSDGDLDFYIPNRVGTPWDPCCANDDLFINDGTGQFTKTTLGDGFASDVAFVDMDGDSDLDLLATTYGGVSLNNGNGQFSEPVVMLESEGEEESNIYRRLALGDLDGDGDIDAFGSQTYSDPFISRKNVWLNDGTGHLQNNGQALGHVNSDDLVLGDLDGDGDLDVFVHNANDAQQVWLNSSVMPMLNQFFIPFISAP